MILKMLQICESSPSLHVRSMPRETKIYSFCTYIPLASAHICLANKKQQNNSREAKRTVEIEFRVVFKDTSYVIVGGFSRQSTKCQQNFNNTSTSSSKFQQNFNTISTKLQQHFNTTSTTFQQHFNNTSTKLQHDFNKTSKSAERYAMLS